MIKTDRVTPEHTPKRTKNGDPLPEHANINHEAYFQKPFTSPGAVHRVVPGAVGATR